MTDATFLVPAALYLRMSTEHQQYSLENQSTAIQRYAESHGFGVVHTYTKALQEYQRSLILGGEPELSATMGRAYAANGWEGVMKKRVELWQKRGTSDYDPLAVAEAYASLGEKDKAFLWLERAYEDHGSLLFIKSEPAFDYLRSDARYAELLRRMGLPQ